MHVISRRGVGKAAMQEAQLYRFCLLASSIYSGRASNFKKTIDKCRNFPMLLTEMRQKYGAIHLLLTLGLLKTVTGLRYEFVRGLT